MLTSHELFGFMSPPLANQILEHAFENDKELYRGTVNSVAEARKLRPIFLERKPRAERNKDIISMLGKPRMELAAANLIRGWLMRKHKQMLIDYLDGLGVTHKDGVVDDLPEKIDEGKLRSAIENLLSKYPHEEVSVYLNAFDSMNNVTWPVLKSLLENDPRLQFNH